MSRRITVPQAVLEIPSTEEITGSLNQISITRDDQEDDDWGEEGVDWCWVQPTSFGLIQQWGTQGVDWCWGDRIAGTNKRPKAVRLKKKLNLVDSEDEVSVYLPDQDEQDDDEWEYYDDGSQVISPSEGINETITPEPIIPVATAVPEGSTSRPPHRARRLTDFTPAQEAIMYDPDYEYTGKTIFIRNAGQCPVVMNLNENYVSVRRNGSTVALSASQLKKAFLNDA